jgi:hypothetical protein
MGRTLRRVSLVLLVVLIAAISITMLPGTALALTDAVRADRAVGYLASKQQSNGSIPAFSPIGSTADAVLAIVAAGTGRDTMLKALGYLHAQVTAGNVNTIGLRAKVAMAVEATGRDPRNYAGHNLLREIRSTIGSNGRFDTASVFDESLALLALEGAGATPPATAVAWLAGAQCPDGGWQYDEPYVPFADDAHCLSTVSPGTDYFESDTNTTAYAVQALEAAGTTSFTHHPFAFFTSLRDLTHGGWVYTWGYTTTDANSTGLVLQAYRAAKKTVPTGALGAIRALQYSACGAFAYSWNGSARTGADTGATVGAVPGLLLRAFPYGGTVTGNALITPACP